MKKIIAILMTVATLLLISSCEKEEPNPFLGSWENRTTTDISLVVMTWSFRSDLTVTFHGVVTVNGQTNESSTEYTYSYTETEITMKEEGEPEETTSYIINSEFLIFSPGTEFAWTFTRVK